MAFKKILVHKNQNKIDGELSQLRTNIIYFQGYVDRLIAIGITVNDTDLRLLFDNPKAYITDKLTQGENIKVGGLSLDKNKLFELLEKPAGTTELIENVLKDIEHEPTRRFHIWKVNYFSVENDTVIVSPEHLEEINVRHSSFIETENQKTGFKKLQQIAELLNEINKLDCNRINSDVELNDLIKFNGSKCEANPTILNRFK